MNTRMLLLLTLVSMAVFLAACDMKEETKAPTLITPINPGPVEPVEPIEPPPPPPPPPPVYELTVEVVRGSGDFFNPVVFSVEYTKDGEPEPYTMEVGEGRVKQTPSGLEITSNGVIGEHTLLINDEEYRYSFEEPPVCAIDEEMVDCVGIQQRLGTEAFIYYGEEDDRIVYWDVIYVGRVGTEEEGVVPPDARLTDVAAKNIKYVNDLYAKSGVFVRLRLAEVWGINNPNGSFLASNYPEVGKADIVAIDGALPGGICGYAGKGSKFRERTFPLRPLFGCGGWSFAHELGHTVGLGHGDNFGENSGYGSTFWFAQGDSFCGLASDIMQYNGDMNKKYHSNHKLTCKELTGNDDQYADDMAGSIDINGTSTAYAINRVRYDVALVHNEYDKEPVAVVETVCSKERLPSGETKDCRGYDYGPVTQSFTWAGDDDYRIAVIELALLLKGGVQGEVIPDTDPYKQRFQSAIDKINVVNLNSGVHIHFDVSAGFYAGPDCYGVGGVPRGLAQDVADIAVGVCPGPTAGEAFIQRSFVTGQRPPAIQAGLSWSTIAHELGHVMGLGHGVWGEPNWRYSNGDRTDQRSGGSVFLAFSHGWGVYRSGEGICGYNAGSMMSYTKSETLGWSNSTLDCKNPGIFGYRRGSRDATDEAYHLNRVRWNVSRVSL